MLTCGVEEPDLAVGQFVDRFLREAPWLRRRVETVAFLDYDTVVRRTSLDVDVAQIRRNADQCPFYAERPIVPLAMMRKDLLTDFDLRDRHGSALAVVPRDVDSFLAWSALCDEGRRVLGDQVTEASNAVARHLRALAFGFPAVDDDPYNRVLSSWRTPAGWADDDRVIWRRLLDDDSFARLLRDFTFNFILATQLEVESPLQIVKFSYQQHLPYSELFLLERLGLRATELAIDAPSVGWPRSYHLRVRAPEDITITDIGLFQIQRDATSGPAPGGAYHARVGAESAQIYTTSSIEPADHVLAVEMRVPVVGYLRAVWLTSIATAVVLVAGRVLMWRVEAAIEGRADAAVALLLVAPSLYAAYLVRPGEHAIASRLLRPARYAVAASGSLSYLAAALLVLGERGHDLRLDWTIISVLVGCIAALLTLVVFLTARDIANAAKANEASEREIVVVPYE